MTRLFCSILEWDAKDPTDQPPLAQRSDYEHFGEHFHYGMDYYN